MIESITSLQNPLVKRVVNLKQKKYRDKENLFIAEGMRLVEDILRSKAEIKYVFFVKSSLENQRMAKIVDSLCICNGKIKLYEVSLAVYEKMAETNEPQGIMAVVQQKSYVLNEFILPDNPFLIVLDNVQDPGNIGTIIRTAEAAGCHGVIMTKGCADIYSGKTVRATMGAMFRLPIISNVLYDEIFSFLKAKSIELFTTEITNGVEYYKENYVLPLALVFGNEGNGISTEMLSKSNKKIYIPMSGLGESLNVGVAAGIIMYEVFRQRNSLT